jgi:hypothetical protein
LSKQPTGGSEPDLTPIERGVLLALMAAARPLRESRDLRSEYGLSIKPAHRTKLQSLGLIETTAQPWTHTLTLQGWHWVTEELQKGPPKGMMGLGALYAVLNGIGRALTNREESAREFFECLGESPKHTSSRNAADADISNAAWAEADVALAFALQDLPSFARVTSKYEATAGGDAAAALRQVRLAGESIFQHLRHAASKRGLAANYTRSEQTPFDPVKFECDGPIPVGEVSTVVKSPIEKQAAGGQIVVVRGLAERPS